MNASTFEIQAVKANTFELQVVPENGANFSYQNPSMNVCIQFSGCANWKVAKSVLWRNLPAQWSIDFFQRDGCLASDGDVYYWTTQKQGEDGVHTFKETRSIRSIYARSLWGTIPRNVAKRCVQLRQRAKRAESVLLSNETTSGSCDDANDGMERMELARTSRKVFPPTGLIRLRVRMRRRTREVPKRSEMRLL